MRNKIVTLFKRLPSANTLFWKQNHTFVTPYTLDECNKHLQNVSASYSLANLKYEWGECDASTSKHLNFTCDNRRSRISVGLMGRIEVQREASNLVQATIGLYYSNLYFFLAFVLIFPIFMASGRQPNILGSYLVSLLGTYVVTLIFALGLVQVAALAFELARHEMIKDLKILLKGV